MAWDRPERVGFDLLRQLALGLSTYRLYPGEVEQPAFVAASERIRDVAEIALAARIVHFDLRAGHFQTADGEILEDDHVARLADAAYVRGIEHLHLRAVPTVEELDGLFEVLSLPEEDVIAAPRGAESLARARGITSVSVGAVAPRPGDAGTVSVDLLGPEQLALWDEMLQPDELVSAVLEGFEGSTAAKADQVYRRLKQIEAELPDAFGRSAEFVDAVERVVSALPDELRREFAALAMMRAGSDTLAERFLSHLTDSDLTDLLALVAEGGADPTDLARRLQQVVGRQSTFVDLVDAMFGPRAAAGLDEGEDPTLATVTAASHANDVRPAVADLVSQRVAAGYAPNAAAIRAVFPETAEEQNAVALTAFRDYLQVIDPGPLFDGALEGWRTALRDVLSQRDVAGVSRFVDAVVTADVGPDQHRAVRAALKGVLDPELVAEMAQWAREDGDIDQVRSLLAIFDTIAVDGLLDALAAEEDRGRRAVMLGMVTELGEGHADLVAKRLDDNRWYVVRNAVTILGRIRGKGSLSALVKAASHPSSAVRREVVRSLVGIAGVDAVPYLARLGADDDDGVAKAAVGALAAMSDPAATAALVQLARNAGAMETRRRALEALAVSRDPEVTGTLRTLGARSSRPRLPWSLRRLARKLARRRERRP